MSTPEQKLTDERTIRALCSAPKGIDFQCYELAAYFIRNVDRLNDATDAEQCRWELAAHIQSKIEAWIFQELEEAP